MPLSPLARWAGPLSVTAAVLVVLSQVLRLGIGMMLGDGSASTPTHTLTYGMALVGMFVLLLALTAVYVREHDTLGRVGLAGYLTAFLGTLLVAGDWWFEAFVVPNLAVEAPAILDLAPSGSMLIGAISTVGLYSVGWILFGLANLRVAEVPRPAAILMVLGGLAGPLALTTPYQVPLAIAVGWMGLALGRPPDDPRSTDTPSDNPPQGEARSSAASGQTSPQRSVSPLKWEVLRRKRSGQWPALGRSRPARGLLTARLQIGRIHEQREDDRHQPQARNVTP